MYYGLGDYKSPGLIGRTFFLRRIANPSGRLAGCVDAWRGVWTPGGVCGRLAGCVDAWWGVWNGWEKAEKRLAGG